MSKAEATAGIILLAATLYAVFGGADFGAGAWQLLAGSARRPARVRKRIERSLAPVWEANHVWLIFLLVFLWTGFPQAFAAIMSTLYIPLALVALGIVLRGAGFAFGKVIGGRSRRQASMLFSLSSIITPFFMGTVVGAIASGEVPSQGNGEPMASWVGAVPILVGALFVASGAYLAAIFLLHDSRAAGELDNERHFAACALGAAVIAGILAVAGLIVVMDDAEFVYDGLTGPALPLVIGSILCGAAALAILARIVRREIREPAVLRPLAVAAVVAVIWGWGVAQHPYLLPEVLTIDAAAAPDATLTALFIIFGAALELVFLPLMFLFMLQQRRLLEDGNDD